MLVVRRRIIVLNDAGRPRRLGADTRWGVRALLPRVRREGGHHPLHVWLPEAHPAAPTNISALMSSVLIKTGVYGIVRVCAFGLGVPRLSWGVFVIALGGLSAVLGRPVCRSCKHDLKRLSRITASRTSGSSSWVSVPG